jgi:hypothetical protein
MSPHTRLAVVRRLGPIVLVLALTVGVTAEAPHLTARRVGSSLTVTFDLRPTRTDDLATRLRGGQPVSVTWQIDVRREVAFWIDQGVKRNVLKVSARRTAEPNVFLIERTINRRALGKPILASPEETYRHLAIKAVVEGGAEARIVTPELARTSVER